MSSPRTDRAVHTTTEPALAATVDRANARLSEPEQIVAWFVREEVWLPGGAELTPTLKMRHGPIAQRYAAQIEALYARDARS